jgi:hypothetical protein
MNYSRKRPFILLLLAITVLLTGCSSKHDLWVYTDGSWKFGMEMEFNFDAVPSFSGSVEGFGLNLNLGSITDQIYQFAFNQKAKYDRSQGLDAKFKTDKKGDQTVYTYTMSGQSIDQLEKALTFDEATVAQLDPGLAASLSDMSAKYSIHENHDGSYDFQVIFPEWNLGETFTLHARQIEDFGTATQVKNNKAVWENPTIIRARFMPISRGGQVAKTVALIGAGAAVSIGVVFLMLRLLGSRSSMRRPVGGISPSPSMQVRRYSPRVNSSYGARNHSSTPFAYRGYGSPSVNYYGRSQSRGMPTWAWVVIGLVVIFVIVLIIVLLVL